MFCNKKLREAIKVLNEEVERAKAYCEKVEREKAKQPDVFEVHFDMEYFFDSSPADVRTISRIFCYRNRERALAAVSALQTGSKISLPSIIEEDTVIEGFFEHYIDPKNIVFKDVWIEIIP